ncbi:MAG: hypothetical protein KC912_13585 [Proteobacteria bacterium]|nr:hypothetical protein [Pseudomonadota bacterium]
MSVADVENDIVAEGVELIWVIEDITFGVDGTAEHCAEFASDVSGSSQGWCVGDGQTQPVAETFDDSPFSEGRGFDILVDRSTMEVLFTTNHGTPTGNENVTGQELLTMIRGYTQAGQ